MKVKMLSNVKTKLFEKAGMQTKTRAGRIPLVPLTFNHLCNNHFLQHPLVGTSRLGIRAFSNIYIYIIYIYIYIYI